MDIGKRSPTTKGKRAGVGESIVESVGLAGAEVSQGRSDNVNLQYSRQKNGHICKAASQRNLQYKGVRRLAWARRLRDYTGDAYANHLNASISSL